MKAPKPISAPGETSTEISARLDALRTDALAADAAVIAADHAYQAGLVDETPATLRKTLDAKTDAAIRGDQARAKILALELELAAALDTEAEARRWGKYTAAKALAEAARIRLFDEYEAACGPIRELLRVVTEADVAVGCANAELPAGAEEIAYVEADRSLSGLPGQVLSQTEVEHWCYVTGSEPVLDAPRKPFGTFREDLVFLHDGDIVPAKKRTFVRTERLPPIPAITVPSLIASVSLPGLHAGEGPFWARVDSLAAAVEQLATPRAPAAAVGSRSPVVTHEPVRPSAG